MNEVPQETLFEKCILHASLNEDGRVQACFQNGIHPQTTVRLLLDQSEFRMFLSSMIKVHDTLGVKFPRESK